MIEAQDEVCTHPMSMVRHLGKSIYACLLCGHESHLTGKPYFCFVCPGVHTLTYPEMLKHNKECHPVEARDP